MLPALQGGPSVKMSESYGALRRSMSTLIGAVTSWRNSNRGQSATKTWLRRSIAAAAVAASVMVFAPFAHDAIPHEHPDLMAALTVGVAQAAGSLSGQQCPASLHDASRWHAPYDPKTECYYGHEHGDAPPDWIAAAGYQGPESRPPRHQPAGRWRNRLLRRARR